MLLRVLPLLASAVFLTACATETNPTITTASGATEVQIKDGLNCYANQCFRYNARNGTVAANGRRDTRPPAGVNLASGSISPAEFSATFEKAIRAATIGGTER